MNVVVLVGRLAQDPEMRTTQSGHNVCTFGLAVNRRFKSPGQPDADFFNVVAWNKQAELICQYLGKGSQIAVQGRLQNRSYQAQDGTNRHVTEVVLDSFDFIGSKSAERQNGAGLGQNPGQFGGQQRGQGGARQFSRPASPEPLFIDDDFSLMADDDDIPF